MSQRWAFLRDVGRCATCPWVKGATSGPAQNDIPKKWPCVDHKEAIFSEQVPSRHSPGGTYVNKTSTDYCARNEVATTTSIVDRMPQTLTWGQIGSRLLRNAAESLRRTLALEPLTVSGGEVVIVESAGAGAHVVVAGHKEPMPPIAFP